MTNSDRMIEARREWERHFRVFRGPLATAVSCRYCEWTSYERKDGTGFAQRSRLTGLAIKHIKASHQDQIDQLRLL